MPSVVTVLVYGKEDGSPTTQGSGWFITPTTIVTCYHVIEGGQRLEVRLYSGEVIPVVGVVADDRSADLAVLAVQATTPSYVPAPTSRERVRAGQPVFVIGSPLGLEFSVSEGIISSTRGLPPMREVLQTTAPVSPGSSGSPLFNRQGSVIGVVSFRFVEGQALNFAVPVRVLRSLKSGPPVAPAQWAENKGAPGQADVLLNYIRGLFLEKKFAEVLSVAQEAAELDPQNVLAWGLIGHSLQRLDRHTEAIEAFKRVVRIDPHQGVAQSWLGDSYFCLDRHREAVDAYSQAVRIDPGNDHAFYWLGNSYTALGRRREAIDAYEQVVRIDPKSANAYCGLGFSYGALGRNREAVNAFEQAVRLDPDSAGAYSGLAASYVLLQRTQAAIDAFQQAVRLDPDNAEAHYNLGLQYVIARRKDAALDQYKVLKRLGSDLAKDLYELINP